MKPRTHKEIQSVDLCREADHRQNLMAVQVRFEDMSPTGRLQIMRQFDGDIILTCIDDNGHMASVEFTTPMAGGGQSENTWKAIIALFDAMKEDNKRPQIRTFVIEARS